MCCSTVLSTFPSPVNKTQAHYSGGGICNEDPCNSRAVSYLDYRDCPVAIAAVQILYSLAAGIPQRYNRCQNRGFELPLPGNLCSLIGKTLLQSCKSRGFESHPSNMPVIFFSHVQVSNWRSVGFEKSWFCLDVSSSTLCSSSGKCWTAGVK